MTASCHARCCNPFFWFVAAEGMIARFPVGKVGSQGRCLCARGWGPKAKLSTLNPVRLGWGESFPFGVSVMFLKMDIQMPRLAG
jgi:hypothetical protein